LKANHNHISRRIQVHYIVPNGSKILI